MTNKNKAVIYARFSPRRRADECESCETQIDYCRNYCKFHKLEVLNAFRDEGLSGANAENRPGLQEAIKAAIANQAIVVIYSLSRLARNVKETIEIADKLHKAKANICSVTENIDTSTAMGSAFFQIIAVLAELERKQVSERTSAAMRYHQANGRRMSRFCPYGWKRDPEDDARMVPVKSEREAIEVIRKLKDEGLSLRKIADKLTELGHKPRLRKKKFKGREVTVKGKWHFGTIRNIIERMDDNIF